MIDDISDIVGIIGVVIILISYILLQFEKMKAKSIAYSVMNLVGAVLILYSLLFNWNLASVVIEIFWILISLFGIGKAIHTKRKHSHH